MKKFAIILLKIFSIGITITLFAGGLTVIGYIVGLCIGGDKAASLCAFIYKQYFPWVIKLTAIFAGIGLIGMYLNKMKALAIEKDGEETVVKEEIEIEEESENISSEEKE